MGESAAASTAAFDPAKEFPNIVWKFDNLEESAAANTATVATSDSGAGSEEITGEGLLTAPPTPSAPASVPETGLASQSVAKQASPAKDASSVKRKSTHAKRKGVATEGPSKKKTKTTKSKSEKDAEDTATVEEKPKARMAKNLVRKEAKREKRRLKRNEIRSKAEGETKTKIA